LLTVSQLAFLLRIAEVLCSDTGLDSSYLATFLRFSSVPKADAVLVPLIGHGQYYKMNSSSLTLVCPLINLLNAELNPICPVLALFGAHHILHVSR